MYWKYFSKIFISLSLLILFTYCNDKPDYINNTYLQKNIINSDSLNADSLEQNIGVLHNIALNLTIDVIKNYHSVDTIKQIIIDSLSNYNSSIFNQDSLNSNNFDIISELPFTSLGDSISINIVFVFDTLKNCGEISNELYHELVDINNDRINNMFSCADSLIKRVEKINDSNLSTNDKRYLNVYLDILKASKEFWESHNLEYGKLSKINDEAGDLGWIASDAAGGLYGMLGGPAWSIFEGALFSAVWVIDYNYYQ